MLIRLYLIYLLYNMIRHTLLSFYCLLCVCCILPTSLFWSFSKVENFKSRERLRPIYTLGIRVVFFFFFFFPILQFSNHGEPPKADFNLIDDKFCTAPQNVQPVHRPMLTCSPQRNKMRKIQQLLYEEGIFRPKNDC